MAAVVRREHEEPATETMLAGAAPQSVRFFEVQGSVQSAALHQSV